MTVQKAIRILDWWINHKKKVMEQLKNDWHYSTFEEATGVAKMIFETDKVAIANLQTIRKELVPDCNHPKEMHDICEGQKYCTGCNMDL